MANILRRKEATPTSANLTEWDPYRLMRDMLRWDPFKEMAPFSTSGQASPVYAPPFEVKETKDHYVFKADLPGVAESDLEISITGNRLTVSGKREAEQHDDADTFYAYERSYGGFTRAFTLPDGADGDHSQADLKNGVLTIVLPKRPEAQPKRIAVRGART